MYENKDLVSQIISELESVTSSVLVPFTLKKNPPPSRLAQFSVVFVQYMFGIIKKVLNIET